MDSLDDDSVRHRGNPAVHRSACYADRKKGIYVFITYNFCTTVVYTALNLPYATLATLMTRDTDQRAVVSLFRTGMSALGNMVITAVTFRWLPVW